MLSYRHAFHAGNHADMLKHSTLVLILENLLKKDKPFTAFDTHAGAGIYRLDDERLLQTGEADSGIKLLLNAHGLPSELASYAALCKVYASHGLYPGSPEIMRHMMRSADKLFLSELHNTEIEVLKGNMQCRPLAGYDPDTAQTNHKRMLVPTIQHKSGFDMLKSSVPPLIKRGLILIDPSYETDSDYTDTAAALIQAHRKWGTGIIALWYPLLFHRRQELSMLKDTVVSSIYASSGNMPPCSIISAELCVARDAEPEQGMPRLYGSGMLIINPPYLLNEQLQTTLPYMARILSQTGAWSIDSFPK